MLIELLNDIAEGSHEHIQAFNESEVFFNSEGQPTDRFLEALKMDLTKLPAFPSVDAQRSQESFHNDYKSDHRHVGNLEREYDEESDSEDDEHLVAAFPQRNEPRHDHYVNKLEKHRSKSHSPVRYHSESLPAYQSRPVTKRAPKASKLAKKKTSNTTTENIIRIEDNNKSCKRCDRRKKLKSTSSNTAPIISTDAPQQTIAMDLALSEESIEHERIIKSLQLRLQGQLSCIKSLEAQLNTATDQLHASKQQILGLKEKNKSLNEQLAHFQHVGMSHGQGDVHEGGRLGDALDKHKVTCTVSSALCASSSMKCRMIVVLH